MRPWSLTACALVACLLAPARAAEDDPPKAPATVVPANVRAAVDAYLAASPEKEDAALAKATAACKGDLAVAAAALRTHAPLTEAGPGVKHGLKFTSGKTTWDYSILLP